MRANSVKILFILMIGTLASGCAIGNKYAIGDIKANLDAAGNCSVVVASLDHREFIVNRHSPDTYVGMVRGGYGNPFDATTVSGCPFADDVSRAVCGSLEAKGFRATPVIVKFDQSENDVIGLLLSKQEDRAIFVIIRKWDSDSYMNLNIGYDLTLKVIAKDGNILASAEAKNDIHLPGNVWTGSLEMSRTEVPNAFRKSIEALLNNPDVVKALSSS